MPFVKVREYHRLKELASKKASRLLQDLDSINREQKSDQDRLDNQGRKNSDLNAKISQKEKELEDNIQRVNKLNEYIKYVFTFEVMAFLKEINQHLNATMKLNDLHLS